MLQNNITLEQVPQIVASLEQKVDRLVNLVLELKDAKGNTPDEWIDFLYHGLSNPDDPTWDVLKKKFSVAPSGYNQYVRRVTGE